MDTATNTLVECQQAERDKMELRANFFLRSL